jgi:hypothetical protein
LLGMKRLPLEGNAPSGTKAPASILVHMIKKFSGRWAGTFGMVQC